MTVAAPPEVPGGAPRGNASGRRAALRLFGLALAVAGLAIGAALLPLERLPRAVSALGPSGPPVAMAIGTVLLAALVPRTAISLASGALFGPLTGGACALAAAMLAAAVTFLAGRWAGRDYLAARAGNRLHRLDGWLSRRGLLAVVVVRLLPLAPYGLVGYAYGTTSVRRRHYLLGTLVGAAPSAFSYAAIGGAVVGAHHLSAVTFIPAALGVLVSAGAAVYWRRSCRSRGTGATRPRSPSGRAPR